MKYTIILIKDTYDKKVFIDEIKRFAKYENATKWLKENNFEIDYALNTQQYSYYHSMTDTRFAEVSSEYFNLEDAEIEIKKEGK